MRRSDRRRAPEHRSAHLSPTVAKVAAGAIEYLPMALVPGSRRPSSGLGRSACGRSDSSGGRSGRSTSCPLGEQPVALVLGSEGTGLAP